MMEPSRISPGDAALPKLPPLDCRIPHWVLEDLNSRLCPFCGAESAPALRRPDDLPVAHCDICAVWYVTSIPRPEKLEQFYEGYWKTFRPARLDARTANFMMRAVRRNGSVDLRRNRLSVILGTLRGKRVVDVGCGLGEFLLAMQAAGAEPMGVEISTEARDFVRYYLGLPVYRELPECVTQSGAVDAIILSDLVEHLVAPVDLLQTAVRGLSPGGVLVIWTPNGGAAGTVSASAKEWVGFRVDLEHLQYLSTRTILLLAGRLGLTVEHLETTGFPYLAGIEKIPNAPSCLMAHLREIRDVVFGSAIGGRVRGLCRSLVHSKSADRTTGTYHLFAILRSPEDSGPHTSPQSAH